MFFSERGVCRSGQYPIARHASCSIKYPYSGHPTSRGSAPLYTEEDHLFWVGVPLFFYAIVTQIQSQQLLT